MASGAANDATVEGRSHRTCILGTAGHIDHGKSALVKALTGTDPDRLPEEKRRGMTIELGFAHLRLAGGGGDASEVDVGIVDVPGHERFVRTMVAGATGIDIGMLVVAADDGVMPQTREHVDILDLLGVDRGLIAVSKADLADAGRIEQVRAGVAELVGRTSLRDWPVVAASARTGAGLDDVRATIRRLAGELRGRPRGPVFRMAIDRVFTVHGRGTVVTGSVLAGHASVGEPLELQPIGRPCKVREAQSFGTSARDVGAGQRAALNLTGVDRADIERGMELATPGYLTPTRYVDARARILAGQARPFASYGRVRLCLAATEAMATMVVIDGGRIEPAAEAYVQLRVLRPIVASHGQRFIIRDETAQATIGGGTVIRPVSRRIRPRQPDAGAELRLAGDEAAFARFEAAVRFAGFEARPDLRLACETGIAPEELPAMHAWLKTEGQLVPVGGRNVHVASVAAIENRALGYLRRHHVSHAAEPGLIRDRFVGWIEARTCPGGGKGVVARLEEARRIVSSGPYVASAEFRPALSPEDAALLERLVAEIESADLDPPAWTDTNTAAGLPRARAKLLEDLARCDPRLTAIGPRQYVSTAALGRFKNAVRALGDGRAFKLAEVRDAVGASRRVVQPLLEYLDRIGYTKRVGDERVLMEPSS